MKIYFIGPLAALILFAAYSWHFDKQYSLNEAAKAEQVREAREAKIKTETEARKKAIEDAVLAQKALKQGRLEKEAEEARKKEVRQAAIDKRDLAFKEQEKLAHQVERLKRDLKTEEDAVAKLDASIKGTEEEKAFDAEFMAKAQQNVAGLSEMLAKVDAADQARMSAPTGSKANL